MYYVKNFLPKNLLRFYQNVDNLKTMNDFGICSKKEIGRRLLVARVKKGLTTLELAEKVNLRDATISRWENGLREGRCREITRTGMFLGLSPDELLLEEKGETREVLENADEEILAQILGDLIRIRQLAPRTDRNPLVSIRKTLANVLEDFNVQAKPHSDSLPKGTSIKKRGYTTEYEPPPAAKESEAAASEEKSKYGKKKRGE